MGPHAALAAEGFINANTICSISYAALSQLLEVAAKSFTPPSVDFDCQLSSYGKSNIFNLDLQPCDDDTMGMARGIR